MHQQFAYIPNSSYFIHSNVLAFDTYICHISYIIDSLKENKTVDSWAIHIANLIYTRSVQTLQYSPQAQCFLTALLYLKSWMSARWAPGLPEQTHGEYNVKVLYPYDMFCCISSKDQITITTTTTYTTTTTATAAAAILNLWIIVPQDLSVK